MSEENRIAKENTVPLSVGRTDMTGENVVTDCQGEFTLPDYMPPIGRILHLDARPAPSGRYVGSTDAECSGSVIYTLLYVGEDGTPAATTLTGEYEYRVPLGDYAAAEGLTFYEETQVEGATARPTGPRSLTLRTKVKGTPHFVCPDTRERPATDGDTETLVKRHSVMRQAHFESGEFGISGNIRREGTEDAEFLCALGDVTVGELRPSPDGILFTGELGITVLYTDIEEGRRVIRSARHRAPIERTVACDTPADGMALRGYGRCISLDAVKNGDTYDIDALVCLYGDGMTEEEIPLLRDAYSRAAPVTATYRQETLPRAVLCRNTNLSLHGQKKLTGESTGATEVCLAAGSASVDGCTVRDGKATLSGTLQLTLVLGVPSGHGMGYSPVGVSLPYKCECEVRCESEKTEYRAVVTPGNIRCRADGDNVTVDAELYVSLGVTGSETVRTVADIKPCEGSVGKGEASVILYYPDGEETLWSVAKTYGISVASLAAQNGLNADAPDARGSLDGVKVLMIR